MSRGPFRAVVFDLFGTIVKWHADRLPLFETRGRKFPSTIPLLVPVLERRLGEAFDLERFLETYFEVLQEIEAERGVEAIEITCLERFARTVGRLDSVPRHEVHDLATELTRVHMAKVRSVTAAPPEHVAAVRRVAERHRIAVLSNFDDSETGHGIVDDTGLRPICEMVLISADVGLRKPNPKIFREVLDPLGLDPAEALYVGDTFADDVAGAQSVGMPVVWLNEGKPEPPAGAPPPDFVVPNVTALPALLECP